MRNTDERIAAVRNRMDALEQQSRRQRSRWIAISSVAVCILAIVALALHMPEWAENAVPVESGGMGTVASLFSGTGELGYLVIGILAFLLGVSVTVLCFRLRKSSQDKNQTP